MLASKENGRLAFRIEGAWWNAYYALPHTMEGAIHLGSIKMQLVHFPEVKTAFMDAMKIAMAAVFKEALGEDVAAWDSPRGAPESEKAGHG